MSRATVVGDLTIHRIVEQQAPFFKAAEFFPALTLQMLEENRSWLEPDYIDSNGNLVLCIQSYVVRTPHHTILIDSCVGNDKPRPSRPFWNMLRGRTYEQNLAAAGLAVGDIDYVMCTHLHVDHVGWNTRLENGRWVPTFPRAKYLFAERELAFWTERQKSNPESCPWILDSVLPIVAANRSQIVKSDFEFDETVKLVPTPGHTIDHFSVRLGRPGQDALITGDMIHSPLQARYPELGMFSDYDSKQAGATRRRMLAELCDTSTLMCTAHFPSPSMGRITRWYDGFRFVPAEEGGSS
jgi:glyoxylase-like metal-dependent hydrolase (beta-lactamase superfamily II)